MTTPNVTIIDCIEAADIWAPWFKRPAQWRAWFCFLKVMFGLPLAIPELKLYRRCTGRIKPLTGKGFLEAWLTVGRRGGKSFILALIACYLACFVDWSPYLTPGERGTIPIVAADKRQARVIFRYCKALLTQVPALNSLVVRADNDSIELSNGVVIEVMAASYRTLRGYTVIAALGDETAFWRVEETSANPDSEILDALRPAMATIPNARLLIASSPYAKRGTLYEANQKHFAQEGDPVLVWRCDTLTMHDDPQVRGVIERAFEDDPVKAASEYGRDGDIQFRADLETFISLEAVNAVVSRNCRERPRMPGISYIGTLDPAGGSGNDGMSMAVSHRDRDGNAVLDVVRERRPPFSPEAVVTEFAAVFKTYGIAKVTGDHWGGEFVREPFRKVGINYELADRPKSDFYSGLLPIINSGNADLLDNPRLISQLASLERRTARSGKDSIDHPPGGHDDVINCAAIALVLAASKPTVQISGAALSWAKGGNRSIPSTHFATPRPSVSSQAEVDAFNQRQVYSPSVSASDIAEVDRS